MLSVRAEEWAYASVSWLWHPLSCHCPFWFPPPINKGHRCVLMPSKPQLLVHLSRIIFWLFQGHELLQGCFSSICHYICVSFQFLCIAVFRATLWDPVSPCALPGKWGVGSCAPAFRNLLQLLLFSLSLLLLRKGEGVTHALLSWIYSFMKFDCFLLCYFILLEGRKAFKLDRYFCLFLTWFTSEISLLFQLGDSCNFESIYCKLYGSLISKRKLLNHKVI